VAIAREIIASWVSYDSGPTRGKELRCFPRSGRVLFPDPLDIVGRFDPFFAEAAKATEISCHLCGTEDRHTDGDVVSGTEGASDTRDANDVVALALWASAGVMHLVPFARGAGSQRIGNKA
jgi:hypothetical protein